MAYQYNQHYHRALSDTLLQLEIEADLSWRRLYTDLEAEDIVEHLNLAAHKLTECSLESERWMAPPFREMDKSVLFQTIYRKLRKDILAHVIAHDTAPTYDDTPKLIS